MKDYMFKNLIKLDSYLEATCQFNLKDVMINLFLIKDILISYKENYICYYVILRYKAGVLHNWREYRFGLVILY